MRENKYRIWDESAKAFSYLDLNAPADPHEFYTAMQLKSDWLQYTGLKDKKRTDQYPDGQEIYEGDIVAIKALGGASISGAVFQHATGEWIFNGPDVYDNAEWNLLRPLEVIGNIHENPELLEAK